MSIRNIKKYLQMTNFVIVVFTVLSEQASTAEINAIPFLHYAKQGDPKMGMLIQDHFYFLISHVVKRTLRFMTCHHL